ncbi:ABC transporter ATP-binding protein [Fervidibacillus halotolerans]|uniref:ABC transporter ATP-binding protein n=1 Tax=Fervidibacillus halotolerans TaxID=2980027 RepID=A0A9E8RZ98_9BACI|nr:ABC transporter ATP-binding protein [Fervidibacillus halotolerans]WAA12959.1 ABC transporter ATP-binding protein [Fervidibacillus halotolerans]
MEPILETKNLTVQFGSHIAVNNVNFMVYEKQFKSIIGPNGAGKTTLFNLLGGQLKATSGKIYFRKEDITSLSSVKRTRKGIGRSFQMTNVFPNLTVFENVRLAVQSRMNIRYPFFKHFSHYTEVNEKTYEILELVLLKEKQSVLAKQLSHGEQRKLEIAMLLALDTEVLLLDEPTAGMSMEEVPAILSVIQNVKKEGNRTIVLIEHKMDLIMNLSDAVTVLFNGQFLADGTPEEIMENETVQNAYLGGLYNGSPS